ncbi:MAG TPA: hypothetical protein DCK95_11780 [Anaerolineaceae bacterium]|nr:hypothetical protein [Anaerolineaceae bacterium]
MKKNIAFLTLIIIFLTIGCSSQQPTRDIQGVEDQDYPIDEETGYPVCVPRIEGETGYPISDATPNYPQGPEFNIEKPLHDGDQVVTGTGPAGVPIRLVNVSEVGLQLGETVITDNGTFTFELDEPLKYGHTIGIQLGDIEGTDLNQNDFLYSETYYERPLVGILFDIASVE